MLTAIGELADSLRGQAVDGVLPPWNEWFEHDPLPRILHDRAQCEAFAAELPRIPLDWLEIPAPVIDKWEPKLCCYVRLSPAYEAEAAEAAMRHWPVRRLDLNHLAMLTDPDRVAEELVSLTPG